MFKNIHFEDSKEINAGRIWEKKIEFGAQS